MAELLKGAPVAGAICEKIRTELEELPAGLRPCLAIVSADRDESRLAYGRAAKKRCLSLGMEVREFSPARPGEAHLRALIEEINRDEEIHGCLLLRPLPVGVEESAVCDLISPEKDVDAAGSAALGALFTGRGAGFAPCTAAACIEMLEHYGAGLAGARVALIGRSLVVGRPLAMLLQSRDATVTLCHSRSRDLPGICRESDIIIAAAGRPGLVDESFVRPGQTVIDVGINADARGNILGDVAADRVLPIVAALSPVPGGVGAVTTAVLCKQLLKAAKSRL